MAPLFYLTLFFTSFITVCMNNEHIHIRPATTDDAEVISHINLICWKTAYRGLLDDVVLDTLSQTPERLERFKTGIQNTPIYLCATCHNAVVGYIAGGKPTDSSLPYPFEVYYLYVHPDHQGKGIGGQLLNAFKNQIKNMDFCLYVLDGNQPAYHFYQKHGGIHNPKYDTDTVTRGIKMHDLCFVFTGK